MLGIFKHDKWTRVFQAPMSTEHTVSSEIICFSILWSKSIFLDRKIYLRVKCEGLTVRFSTRGDDFWC